MSGKRIAFTLVEAMVMIIIASACFVPIIGTLQVGIDKSVVSEHKFRMKKYAESMLNNTIATFSYTDAIFDETIATKTIISWPNKQEPIATYICELIPDIEVNLATVTGGLTGDHYPLTGVQPQFLKQVKIVVSMQNDDPTVATETVILSTLLYQKGQPIPPLVSIPGDKIYLSEPDQLLIYSLTAQSPYASETFSLPKANPAKAVTDPAQATVRPGNLAIHPNGKWLAYQCLNNLNILAVASDSYNGLASTGAVFTVYKPTPTVQFLEDSDDQERIRKDRGVAFRSDGRFCYATSHNPVRIHVLEVPAALPASFTLINQITLPNNTLVNLTMGEDGYLYIVDYISPPRIFRLNTVASHPLEILTLPGWDSTALGMAAATTRDGRYLATLWKFAKISWCPTDNISSYSWAQITDGNPAMDECRDIKVSCDSKYAFVPTKNKNADTRIYSVQLPFNNATFLPNFQNAYPGYNETSNQLILSSYMKDILVDRNSKDTVFFVDIASLNAGLFNYPTAFPADRIIKFSPTTQDAACLTSRLAEKILLGTSNTPTGGTSNCLEYADLYAEGILTDKKVTLDNKSGIYDKNPICVALSPGGDKALYAFIDSSGANYIIRDTADSKISWSSTQSGPTDVLKCTFTIDGGWIVSMRSGTDSTKNGYRVYGPDASVRLTQKLPVTQTIIDMKPLNEGGALILIQDSAGFTELHWIGTSSGAWNGWLWAKWSSLYDDFLSPGTSRIAISADDSLLALYDPNGTGSTRDTINIFDFQTQNFGDKTQMSGLICDYRNNGTDFQTPVPSVTDNMVMTGTGYKLINNFTCNDSLPSIASYPANFFFTSSSKFGGTTPNNTGACRFFGYFIPSTSVNSMAIAGRDAAQLILDGKTPYLSHAAWGDGGHDAAAINFAVNPAARKTIQIEHSSNSDDNVGAAVFTSAIANGNVSGDGSTSVNATHNRFNPLSSTNGANWQLIPASDTRPLIFNPQFLYSHTTSQNITGTKTFMAFSRDIASPTLYIFDSENLKFWGIPFGGSAFPQKTLSDITTNSTKDMLISHDGQRLIIVADKIYLLNTSIPVVAANFGSVIASFSPSLQPLAAAVRQFNRHKTATESYEVVATFTTTPPYGSSIGALASGAIYILGGTSPAGSPLGTIFEFNPVTNALNLKSETLEKPVMRPAVLAYDNELITFNGEDSTAITDWVQKYDPARSNLTTSAEPPPTLPTGLISHWAFDETSLTTAFDSASTNHGTLVGSPGRVAGKYGNCLQFDGTTNMYVNCGNSASLLFGSNNFSIAFWFNTTVSEADGGSFRSMINWGDCAVTSPVYGRIDLGSGLGKLESYWGNGSRVNGGTACHDGTWHHATLTRNGNVFQFYRDGVADGSPSTVAVTFALNYFIIGKGPWSADAVTASVGKFKGMIDDVKVYNRALTAAEILLTMAAPVSAPSTSISKTKTDDGFTTTARRSHGGCMTPYGAIVSGGFTGAGATSSVQIYWPHAVASRTPGINDSSDQIARLKFDETSGTSAADSSGNNHNATLTSMSSPGCWVAGQKKNCLDFDGINDYAQIPTLNGNLTTICFWIIEDTATLSDWTGPLCQATTDTNGFQFRKSAPGYGYSGRYALKIGSTENDTNIVPDQAWKHITLVRDTGLTQTRVYENGILKAAISGCWTTAGSVRLGMEGTFRGNFWNGKIDDLVIFNRVLSVAEIRQVMGNAFKYELDELSVTVTADSSGNNYPGTLVNFSAPACWGTGKYDNALQFDGNNDYVDVSTTPLTTAIDDITMSAWVKWGGSTAASQMIMVNGSSSTNGYALYLSQPNSYYVYVLCGGVNTARTTYTLPVGDWTHVAAVRESGIWRIFINGVAQSVTNNPVPNAITSGLTRIGANNVGNECFNGSLDNVMLSTRAFSASEIESLMSDQKNVTWGIWRDLPNMPGIRVNHSLVWHKQKLYRIGGGTDATAANTVNGVDRFDPATNQWTLLTTADDADEYTDTGSLFRRQWPAVCSFRDEIFIFGGVDAAGTTLNTAAAWNPSTKKVRILKNIPQQTLDDNSTGIATRLISAVPSGSHIYLFGGTNSTTNKTSKQVLRYTP
ncbi:MAG: hypothetical protein HQM10_18730 [Candidatus Riflebacteria bacterium]|nr:hypothetical protein [Candidatus Riflebacteria bacterium]